ncbi:hypothetical protein [Desulfofarcimen acetoxidans]|uniref:hypothetical protein n=1 Tax=Desulfofarcimen acetoxidans TaxID=58138 RepID=UPI001F613CDA|nr:hypothetical protein [Desulfofarcimen acetoxidans]
MPVFLPIIDAAIKTGMNNMVSLKSTLLDIVKMAMDEIIVGKTIHGIFTQLNLLSFS